MFIAPSALAEGSVFAAPNLSVINMSVEWGRANEGLIRDMGLSHNHLAQIEGVTKPERAVPRLIAVDTFKLVYAADKNAQLPRGTVNDTLARLSLVARPENIGRSIRGLPAYPSFAADFKSRFGHVVKLAQQLSAEILLLEKIGNGGTDTVVRPGVAVSQWEKQVYLSQFMKDGLLTDDVIDALSLDDGAVIIR